MSEVRSGMVIAGKYRLEAMIARGGMGSVWRARHLMLETHLAIKFIGADVFALQEARRRFEREAKAAALLQSSHVVQIHDYGVEGDVPYLVMELLHGEDLGTRLKRVERLDPAETCGVVVQVARALRRAAEAGIVHRDLKPSNVFLVEADEDEELIKVLDFGIAKAPRALQGDDDSTKMGAIIGSPRYMSPEQAQGSPLVDPRSDLWSLGVIAYRALTGELPFQSTDLEDLIRKICHDTPTPPSRLVPELGPEIDAFFVRALARDPAARFQTARELATAFALAAGEPPPSVGALRGRWRTWSGEMKLATLTAPPPPTAPSPTAELAPAAGDAAEARCERTRISAAPPLSSPVSADSTTSPESAAARRGEPRSKVTPTPYPSDIDLPPERHARPPGSALVGHIALTIGVAVLLGAGVIALAPWRRAAGVPSAVALATSGPAPPAPPPAEASVAIAASVAAPSPSPERSSTATAMPSATPSVLPAAASAEPRRAPMTPPHPAGSKKKHSILGI